MHKIFKKGILILLMGTMVSLWGCAEEAANVEVTGDEAVDNQEEITEDGYIIEYSEDGLIKYVRKQDRTLVEKHFLFLDGTLNYYEVYDRDENGVYTGRTCYDRNGKVTNINTFEYDEDGDCVKYYIYTPDMVLEQIGTYVFDENKNLTGVIYETASGMTIEEQVWDEQARIIIHYLYNPDGHIGNTLSYEYDEANRVIKQYMYDSFKREYIDSHSEYKYDDHNNKIESKTYYYSPVTGEAQLSSHYTSEYDEFDRVIRSNSYSTETGELKSYRITEYLDKMKVETNYSADGTKGGWTETYYDENGERIGVEIFNADGTPMFARN